MSCQRCGAEILVRARGPLPRFCRHGCRGETGTAGTAAPRSTAAEGSAPPPGTAGSSAAAFASAIVTRLDTAHPVATVGAADLDRRVRSRRIRNGVAIGLWVSIVAIIVLILLLGSRPVPVDFDSYQRLVV